MANKAQSNIKYKKGYGEHFKAVRKKHGLSAKQIQDMLGISYATVSDIENERRVPTIEQLQLYHDAFHVSFDYLIGEIDEEDMNEHEVCQLTGLTPKALKEIIKCNAQRCTRNFGSKITEEYRFINALNYLLESENFFNFIQPLSCVYKYCRPQLHINEDVEKFDFLPENVSVKEANNLMAKIDEYCYENRCELVSTDELARLKLSDAQFALLVIFDRLIRESFDEDLED